MDEFDKTLRSQVKELIVNKKAQLRKTSDIVEELGIPLKRRQDLAEPYQVPLHPKMKRAKPPVTVANEGKYWAITEGGYEDILDIIQSMSILMERSPKTFRKLEEEEIRDHFLMLLNIYFEGQATGETFNYKGKTDILIRARNKNVFVAECKIWHGPKYFAAAIDQLFKYTNWRDTKTAIILFHKGGDFTKKVEKIRATVTSRANYIRERKLLNSTLAENETISSYILHYPDDKEREVTLTTMSFSISPA